MNASCDVLSGGPHGEDEENPEVEVEGVAHDGRKEA